jgi:hypothetical protein
VKHRRHHPRQPYPILEEICAWSMIIVVVVSFGAAYVVSLEKPKSVQPERQPVFYTAVIQTNTPVFTAPVTAPIILTTPPVPRRMASPAKRRTLNKLGPPYFWGAAPKSEGAR